MTLGRWSVVSLASTEYTKSFFAMEFSLIFTMVLRTLGVLARLRQIPGKSAKTGRFWPTEFDSALLAAWFQRKLGAKKHGF